MTSDQKEQPKSDLPALVCQLRQLADKIQQQVEQELAGVQEARQSGAQKSAGLEERLAETHSAVPGSGQDAQNSLGPAPDDSGAEQSQAIWETLKKHHEIYSLAEKGLKPLEIAQRTGRTLGEIQVILALRKSE